VARLIAAPRPVMLNISPWKRKYSATMLAFRASEEHFLIFKGKAQE